MKAHYLNDEGLKAHSKGKRQGMKARDLNDEGYKAHLEGNIWHEKALSMDKG